MLKTATKKMATITDKRDDKALWDVYYALEVQYFNTYDENYFDLMAMVQKIMELKVGTGRLYRGLVLYVLSRLNHCYQSEYEAHIGDDTAEAKTEQTSSKKESSSESDDEDSESSSKSAQETIDGLTKALNSDLVTEDTGDTTWSWNKEDQCWEATLDQNSTMYQAMDEGQVSIWNSYVRDIQEESKTAKDEKIGFMSTFKVLNPNDTDRCYLIVENGKVKYDVGEDLDN